MTLAFLRFKTVLSTKLIALACLEFVVLGDLYFIDVGVLDIKTDFQSSVVFQLQALEFNFIFNKVSVAWVQLRSGYRWLTCHKQPGLSQNKQEVVVICHMVVPLSFIGVSRAGC